MTELHNVTWPTRRQAIHTMITVVVIMLVVGIFLAVLDNGLGKLFARIVENAGTPSASSSSSSVPNTSTPSSSKK